MNPRDYEIAVYAQSVWQLANSSDGHEITAVACALRNNVVARLGQTAPYASFLEACEDSLKAYPVRPRPQLTDRAFIELLRWIEECYNCEMVDITASLDNPNGARYFARVTQIPEDHWFRLEILDKQAIHPLIGTFGSMQFFS